MSDQIREISDLEMENVNGGSHLSSDDVKNLVPGTELMVEDCMFDTDLAKGIYTGNWRDPGSTSMLEVEVEITEIYHAFSSHGINAEVGKKLFISRWCVDFYERA